MKPNGDDEPAGPVHKLWDVSYYDQRVIRSSLEAVVSVPDLSWWSTPPSDFHSRERPRSAYDAPSTSPWLPVAQPYTRYNLQVSGADPSPTTRRVIYIMSMRVCYTGCIRQCSNIFNDIQTRQPDGIMRSQTYCETQYHHGCKWLRCQGQIAHRIQ